MNDEDFRDLICGDLPGWQEVTKETIVDQSRWSVYRKQVFREIETNKLYEAYWGSGATEYQDGQDEYWSLIEVEPKEVTTTVYTRIQDGQKFEGTI